MNGTLETGSLRAMIRNLDECCSTLGVMSLRELVDMHPSIGHHGAYLGHFTWTNSPQGSDYWSLWYYKLNIDFIAKEFKRELREYLEQPSTEKLVLDGQKYIL